MKNDPTLKRWFREYNRRYFDNALPNATVFWEPSFVTGDDIGECQWRDTEPKVIIRIDPSIKFSSNHTRLVLLHECIHLKLGPEVNCQTEAFKGEIARLVALGAYTKLL